MLQRFFIFALLLSINSFALQREAALYIVSEQHGGTLSKTLSTRHMLDVAGIPCIETTNLDTALNYSMVLFSSRVLEHQLSEEQIKSLTQYSETGGALIIPKLEESRLFSLFGISSFSKSSNQYALHYQKESDTALFTLFDHAAELQFQFGDTIKQATLQSVSYTCTSAKALARYENESVAITQNMSAYVWGLSWKDLGVRYLLNKDYNSGRSYSNGFEPDLDMTMYLLRNIYRKHMSNPVIKSTLPKPFTPVIIITHDCDSRTSMEHLLSFARYEESRQIPATYTITTHYIDDDIAGDYYTPFIDTIKTLATFPHEIASHSVGHFPDFGSGDFPIGQTGNTKETYTPFHSTTTNTTSNGSLIGELEVSKHLIEELIPGKVTGFRSGHLAYHSQFINILEATGYQYNSSLSANDITTSFPFSGIYDNSFSGAQSTVIELPMTISDVFSTSPIDSLNWPEKVAIWDSVTTLYHANESPVVLLIHPNREWKIQAESTYISQHQSSNFMTMQAYVSFWKARQSLTFSSTFLHDTLSIFLDSLPAVDIPLTLPQSEVVVRVFVAQTETHFLESNNETTRIIHSIGKKEPIVIANPIPQKHPIVIRGQHLEIPYTFQTPLPSLRIHNLKGQLLCTISPQKEGNTLQYTLPHMQSGYYIYSIGVWKKRHLQL